MDGNPTKAAHRAESKKPVDKHAIGFILSAGPKGYRAFDEEGKSLGLFDNEDLAARAIYQNRDVSLVSVQIRRPPPLNVTDLE